MSETELQHDTYAHIDAGGFGLRAPRCPACVQPQTSVRDLVEGEYDHQTRSVIVKVTENWIVAVAPMMFNDRIFLTGKHEWPWRWTAGWCFDKGAAAGLAAAVWDPETEWAPVGFKKTANDARACNAPVEARQDHLHDCFCTLPRSHDAREHSCDHGLERTPE